MGRSLFRWTVLALAPTACDPPAASQAIVVVDTDLAVPSLVDHLRVDLYAEDGTWYQSRDFTLANPSDWPTSFGVFLGDTQTSADVLVRLRAYADGNVRQYLGERYQPKPVFTEPFTPQSINDLCANTPHARHRIDRVAPAGPRHVLAHVQRLRRERRGWRGRRREHHAGR